MDGFVFNVSCLIIPGIFYYSSEISQIKKKASSIAKIAPQSGKKIAKFFSQFSDLLKVNKSNMKKIP